MNVPKLLDISFDPKSSIYTTPLKVVLGVYGYILKPGVDLNEDLTAYLDSHDYSMRMYNYLESHNLLTMDNILSLSVADIKAKPSTGSKKLSIVRQLVENWLIENQGKPGRVTEKEMETIKKLAQGDPDQFEESDPTDPVYFVSEFLCLLNLKYLLNIADCPKSYLYYLPLKNVLNNPACGTRVLYRFLKMGPYELARPMHNTSTHLKRFLKKHTAMNWDNLLDYSFADLHNLDGVTNKVISELKEMIDSSYDLDVRYFRTREEAESFESVVSLLTGDERKDLEPNLRLVWKKDGKRNPKRGEYRRSPENRVFVLKELLEMPRCMEFFVLKRFQEPTFQENVLASVSEHLRSVIGDIVIPRMLLQKHLFPVAGGLVTAESTFENWESTLEGRSREIFELRFGDDLTLEEIGEKFGLTRERVRQILLKILSGAPKLNIDAFSYWFNKYDIREEQAHAIFSLSDAESRYLRTLSPNAKDKLPFEEIEFDPLITPFIRWRMNEYKSRFHIRIGDEYVPRKRRYVVRAFMKLHGNGDTRPVEDIYEDYQAMLEELDLTYDSTFSFPSFASFKSSLFAQNYVITSWGETARYYEMDEHDWAGVVSLLDLNNHINKVISTRLLYNGYPELMKELDLRDAYELHNALRKSEETWKDLVSAKVEFTRTPMMCIGEADQIEQLKNLLYELAPVSRDRLVEVYSERYGDLPRTVSGNLLTHIRQYDEGDVYKVDQPEMTPEQKDALKNSLPDHALSMDDVITLFQKVCPGADRRLINARNLYDLGYKTMTRYIVPLSWRTVDSGFKNWIEKQEQFALKDVVPRAAVHGGYCLTHTQVILELRRKLEILEIERNVYMRKDTFLEIYNLQNTSLLSDYILKSNNFSKNTLMWNDYSIRCDGFEHPVYSHNIPSVVLDLLRKNMENDHELRILDGRPLFFASHATVQTCFDDIVNHARRMYKPAKHAPTTRDIQNYIRQRYGLEMSDNRLYRYLAACRYVNRNGYWVKDPDAPAKPVQPLPKE